MLDLFRKVSRYGLLTIEWLDPQWRLGCIVHTPERKSEKFVSVYTENIQRGLFDLETKAMKTYYDLIQIENGPKQGVFEYGIFKGNKLNN